MEFWNAIVKLSILFPVISNIDISQKTVSIRKALVYRFISHFWYILRWQSMTSVTRKVCKFTLERLETINHFPTVIVWFERLVFKNNIDVPSEMHNSCFESAALRTDAVGRRLHPVSSPFIVHVNCDYFPGCYEFRKFIHANTCLDTEISINLIFT